MISFTCHCGRRLLVPPEHASKRIKCPKCLAVNRIPKPPVDVSAWELDLAGVGRDDSGEGGSKGAVVGSGELPTNGSASGPSGLPLAGGVFEDDDFNLDFTPYANEAAALDGGPGDVGPEKGALGQPDPADIPAPNPDPVSFLHPPGALPLETVATGARPIGPEILLTPVAPPLPAPTNGTPPTITLPKTLRVTVTGVEIPFFRLVGLLLRLMLASVPASILFSVIMFLVWAVVLVSFGGVLAAVIRALMLMKAVKPGG